MIERRKVNMYVSFDRRNRIQPSSSDDGLIEGIILGAALGSIGNSDDSNVSPSSPDVEGGGGTFGGGGASDSWDSSSDSGSSSSGTD